MLHSKVLDRSALAPICDRLQAAGKRVVYTSGVFDLLHIGHAAYLEKAKGCGDILVVGVNSDESVREIKGELRPIIAAADRAALVAALGCVDYVFIFGEKNNNENIRTLKPAIYAKAGDYKKEKLSSAAIVESYGGKVELIQFEAGYSSSSIIDRIAARYGHLAIPAGPDPQKQKAPAVFLDRDGTLNAWVDYLSEPEKFTLLPGVIEALKRLKTAGYYLVITTNQPGIGLGYFSREDLYAIHRKFMKLLSAEGVLLDKVYFCPHSDADKCSCRKPYTGMIDRACRELPIDRAKSFVVGDMTTDLEFAKNAQIRSILVQTGYSGKDGKFSAAPTLIAKDILGAAALIIDEGSK